MLGILPVLALFLALGCRIPQSTPQDETNDERGTIIRFEEPTHTTGLEFAYRNGAESDQYTILETLGGGVAILDFDADGRQDVFIAGGGIIPDDLQVVGRPAGLYRHLHSLRFLDVTGAARCGADSYYSHGVYVCDFDDDGFPDVLVTGYGGLQLWRNSGDGTWVQSASPAGLDDESWSTGAAWGDLDGDGDADLYIAHYVDWDADNNPRCDASGVDAREVCGPRAFNGLPDGLWRNRGDGTFEAWSHQPLPESDGKGLGVLIADVDVDRDLDVYVANDTTKNVLYVNDGDGRLEEIGVLSGAAYSSVGVPDGSMGTDLADFDGDGQPDLWVTNFEGENFALYRNNGRCLFTHVSQTTGVTDVGGLYVGWGTSFSDFDLDGDEDVISINGHLLRHPLNSLIRQRPLLLENRDGRFFNVSGDSGQFTATTFQGRGLATGDLDDDGDVDLIVSHMNEPVSVVENVSQTGHHWISVRLIGRRTHRDAAGTIVRVTHDGQTQVKQVRSGASYLSSCDRRLVFGLGDSDRVESVSIEWPAGSRQILESPDVDRLHTVVEPIPSAQD